MHLSSSWYSSRTQCEIRLSRWGVSGQPVLILPTAGGDAEEIDRFLMIQALEPLLAAGKIKVYSCDSVAGRSWFSQFGTPGHRMWLNDQFQEYVRHEVVPAIHMDCNSEALPIWTAGASIGAFHAVALVCRYPDVFTRAVGMSGTYNLMRFIETDHKSDHYLRSSPLDMLALLTERHLNILRTRHIQLVTGEGRYENVGESWAMANTLGQYGVPNFMDSWGPQWHHDWQTWREMLPRLLTEWTA